MSFTDSSNSMASSAVGRNEVVKLNFLGRGSYGTVHRAKWQGRIVAVKEMDYSPKQRKEFETELKVFGIVKHENIVKLLAHSISDSFCSLVMEFAESGNLYELIHNSPDVDYGMDHALSWSHQTAQALAYLHNLEPTPLIHRDVKPPNLLLTNYCRTIKICDFGTACDIHTHMTTNKGSACWMAPEVFNTHADSNGNAKRYTEKCDIFSFGITVWEIFARRKPFDGIFNPYAVMWAVNAGTRPPLLQNCPQVLEELMTRCWAGDPADRPSMSSVEKRLDQMTALVIRGELPKIYLPKSDFCSSDSSALPYTEYGSLDTATAPANCSHNIYAMLQGPAPHYQPFMNTDPGGSQENLLDIPVRRRQPSERNHEDQTSHLAPYLPERRPRSSSVSNSGDKQVNELSAHRFKSTTDTSAPYDEVTPSTSQASNFRNHVVPSHDEGYKTGRITSIQAFVTQIEPEFRPLQPDPNIKQSMEVFERHQKVCHKHMKLSTEFKLLQKREEEIEYLEKNGLQSFDLQRELNRALDDKESLTKWRDNLLKKLERIRNEKLHQEAEKDGFLLIN